MSGTAFDALLDAFVSKLEASPAVSTTVIADSDEEVPIPSSKSDAVNVSLVQSDPTEIAMLGLPVDWSTEIKVECYAQAAAASARTAVNALVLAAYAKPAADTSVGIPGVSIGQPRIEWSGFKGEKRVACASLTYLVTHQTANLTLT